ncbi:MAG: saccharopine dehydrogenase NADP-binding domain-containing protein [Bacteroidetes bacterium]|nr:saccharopine dehydrogenase NADP-binding domain-containing protein [Bacteroidota bacterium]
MKVFALGGYGKVGFPAIKLLAQSDLVTEIDIVGRSLEHAEKAAREIGEKAIVIHTDGTDEQELTLLLAGYDIIMNSATDETVLPTIRAAIRTGTHYCDAAVVNEQALQLASEAEAVGITAIVANGIHPGISNLMGVHVA